MPLDDASDTMDPPSERTRWTGAHKWVAGQTALIGLVGATLFYTASGSVKTDIWMTSTGLMLATMYLGIFRFRRANLKPWLLVAGGLTSAYVAMFLMNYGSWFGLSFGAPSLLDGLMLANYPLATLGAIIMLSRFNVRTGMHALLETVTLTVAGGLLIYVFVGVRAAEAAAGTAATIVAALYPAGNVLLLAVLVAVAVRLRERPGGMLLVALGFAGNLAADLISSWQRLEGTYQPGGWVDFGWLLCFIGLSAAPSWPESGRAVLLSESIDTDEAQMTPGRLSILLFALLSAPAVLIGQQLGDADTSETVAVLGTVVVLALALGRIALYNQDLRRKEAALQAANAELVQSQNDKQSLLWRLNRAVEEERKRIAADIHDRPVQQLAALGYKVETVSLALMSGDVDKASDLTEEVADELSEQLTNLRNLMTEVRPPVLDERGLCGAIEDAGRAFAAKHDGVEVTVEGGGGAIDAALEPDAETALYRIAQEALANIGKHAEASNVTIEIRDVDGDVELTVTDDGVGFRLEDRAGFVGAGHFGLAGMGERIAMLGGSMDVESEPGAGTSLRFRLPNDVRSTTDVDHQPQGDLAATGA
ncbi:MAG: sensor histidine kinase [Actinomycetota bacterium]